MTKSGKQLEAEVLKADRIFWKRLVFCVIVNTLMKEAWKLKRTRKRMTL